MVSWNITFSTSWYPNTRMLHITLQKNEPFPTNKVKFLEYQRSTCEGAKEEGRIFPFLWEKKSSGKLYQQFKFVLVAKVLERKQEITWEMILKLNMIFIVSLQWCSQIMTLCYCTNKAGSSFSSGNNYSVLSYSACHQNVPFCCHWAVAPY